MKSHDESELHVELNGPNCLRGVIYDREHGRSIKIYKDENKHFYVWLPKSCIKGGWNKNNTTTPQDIGAWIPRGMYWKKVLTPQEYVESYLLFYCPENIIAIYGIGSYFDENTPQGWDSNDVDFIAVVKNFSNIEKDEKTLSRHKSFFVEGNNLFIAFHTLETLNDKKKFITNSFANYEWALKELKLHQNSKFLYGEDIRDKLPAFYDIGVDYEDTLKRVFYHLEKGLKAGEDEGKVKREFTKAVFKFCYYLSILYNPKYKYTSSILAAHNVRTLSGTLGPKMSKFIENSIIYRCNGVFIHSIISLYSEFIEYIFSMVREGMLHRKMGYHDLLDYLKNTYEGLENLGKMLEKSGLNRLERWL